MRECVLCKTRYQKGSGVTFHKFPSDEGILKLWLQNIEKPGWHPKKYDNICSKHFSDDCFIKHTSYTTLKKHSVPTMFCSSDENISSRHESIVLPTPGTRKVTSALSVPETIAVDIKREITGQTVPETIAVEVKREITDQNDNNSRCQKCKTTSYDPQLSIASILARAYIGSSPSTQEKVVSPTPLVSGTRIVMPLSVSGKLEKKRLMQRSDTKLSCRRRQSTSRDLQHSIPSKNVRSLVEVCDIIKHDHRYENTPKSSENEKELQRVKQSLRKSRVRVKVLSQKVKRLKVNVSHLRKIITELKKMVNKKSVKK